MRTGEARHYFGIEPDAGVDEVTGIAGNYPIFRVDPADDAGAGS